MLEGLTRALEISPDEVDRDIKERHRETISIYDRNIERCLKNHPLYRQGWSMHVNTRFFGPSRGLNRLLYRALADTKKSVLDIGCFDGVLIKLLRERGVEAWGAEAYPFGELYECLSVGEYVNKGVQCDIVISFNIAHEYSIEGFLKRVEKENNGLPEVLIFDREESRRRNSPAYYDEANLKKYGFVPFKVPTYHTSVIKPDLLIRTLED